MEIGFSALPTSYSMDIATVAKRAEELGFESLWVPEHPVLPVDSKTQRPGYPPSPIPKWYADQADPFVSLARASAVTTTIKLGTGVCIVPERSPLVLAKEVATLDMYSGGRFLFGIGAGWLREETELMGGDFDHRWTQTKEAILVMKELWTKDEAEFHGQYFDFPLVRSYPKPAQKPHPPIIIGGMAKNVLRRVVAHADGWLPNRVSPAQVEESRAKLDAMAEEAGRDPASLTITVYGQDPDRTLLQSLINAGANRVVIRPEHCDTEKEMGDQLERIAEAVLR